MIRRAKLHRATFLAAGLYNIAWGLYAIANPQWMFRFAGLPDDNHPEIFACLGMVLGLYGVVYLIVARDLIRGWPFATIGFAGKLLGPLGWLQLILQGTWPWSTAVLCVPNDLVWWIPFGLYLFDAWPAYRRDRLTRRAAVNESA